MIFRTIFALETTFLVCKAFERADLVFDRQTVRSAAPQALSSKPVRNRVEVSSLLRRTVPSALPHDYTLADSQTTSRKCRETFELLS